MNRPARHGVILAASALLVAGGAAAADRQPARHAMTGMVMAVDSARRSVVVSHDAVPGVMPAMTMPFDVRDARELVGVAPGATVTFTLVLRSESAFVEGVRVVPYQSVEQDPLTARRLQLLQRMTASTGERVAIGHVVPDFTLTNQAQHPVTLSQFRGKVVAINFIYTSCALPQFCYRIANHFGVVQQRLASRMGRDLVLLTVTFDPARDTPDTLAEYARQWKANPSTWSFLTGAATDVQRVCAGFGVDFFPDEGLMNHSIHTAVIDRHGRLVANIEGNRFSAAQLGDLVETALNR